MRILLFALSLIALGGIGLIFPAAIWFPVVVAIVSTVIWLYFSLRDAELERGSGPPELDDGTLLNVGTDANADHGSHG